MLVFEDLQWADEGLLDFIEHLLDWSRDKPILIVTLARPELLERRPGFGRSARNATQIELQPLRSEAITELATCLLEAGQRDLADVAGHRRKWLEERLGDWSAEDLASFATQLERYNRALDA